MVDGTENIGHNGIAVTSEASSGKVSCDSSAYRDGAAV
jgi:hypothetical protein